jgi:nicotinate-nucleotide--dimethylbenzimidazole phosphoribosyltransferase
MQRLNETLAGIRSIDHALAARTQDRLDHLTKPQGSLGRLEDLARQVVEITGEEVPRTANKVIFTLAGDHGVAQERVSAFPPEVTAQMVHNFLRGGAGISVLARHVGARVVVVDMGVATDLPPHPALVARKIGYGTRNIRHGPAMTRDEAIRCVQAGMQVFEAEFPRGVDLAGTGEMGIGNTTPSSAIAAVITGRPVEDVTGKGTGIHDEALAHKIDVIRRAIEVNQPDPNDALDVLGKVGGYEIGGLAGVILAAASKRVPVVIDGFISGAAALLAYRLAPGVKDYMIAAHRSVERGHRIILDYLGLEPLLDLDLRLGEGTGAALGMSLVEAAVRILTEMATFRSAAVSERMDP